jgi:CHASE2 domain-containing sensor protein
VVVSIDEHAASQLDLPARVRDWPRAYHARLIDRLVKQGASVIAFDLQFFRDGAEADDAQLAAALRSVTADLPDPMCADLGGGSRRGRESAARFTR